MRCPKAVVILGLVLLVTVSLAALFSLARRGSDLYYEWERNKLANKVQVGMTRAQVIATVGQPDLIAHSLGEFYDVDRGSYTPLPSAPVENEVLQYRRSVWKLYVYVGKDNRVSLVMLGRT